MKKTSGFNRSCCLVIIGFIAMACAGCDSAHDYGPTGTVSGKLSYNGETVAPGTAVVFVDMAAGYTCMGATDAEGNYTLSSWNEGDLPVGSYDVMIRPVVPEMDSDLDDPEAAMDNPEPVAPMEYDFPEKYGALATSGLKFEVKEGANDIPIDLVD